MNKLDDLSLPSLALVFGYIAVKELHDDVDKIRILSRLGYGNSQIAKICGISVNSVAVGKHRINKSKKEK